MQAMKTEIARQCLNIRITVIKTHLWPAVSGLIDLVPLA